MSKFWKKKNFLPIRGWNFYLLELVSIILVVQRLLGSRIEGLACISSKQIDNNNKGSIAEIKYACPDVSPMQSVVYICVHVCAWGESKMCGTYFRSLKTQSLVDAHSVWGVGFAVTWNNWNYKEGKLLFEYDLQSPKHLLHFDAPRYHIEKRLGH